MTDRGERDPKRARGVWILLLVIGVAIGAIYVVHAYFEGMASVAHLGGSSTR